MKLDPDKYKMFRSYVFSLVPFIVSLLMFIFGEKDNETVSKFYLMNVLFGGFISIGFINAVNYMFSFSIFANHNLIYLMSDNFNHRIAWDDIKEVYLGYYTWLNIRWLCFFHNDDDAKKHLIFRLSVLSDKDIDKLLAKVKETAQARSIKINY